jgi:hypothetical protein
MENNSAAPVFVKRHIRPQSGRESRLGYDEIPLLTLLPPTANDKINISLEVASLEELDCSFCELSYVLGGAANGDHVVVRDGKVIAVTESFCTALNVYYRDIHQQYATARKAILKGE